MPAQSADLRGQSWVLDSLRSWGQICCSNRTVSFAHKKASVVKMTIPPQGQNGRTLYSFGASFFGSNIFGRISFGANNRWGIISFVKYHYVQSGGTVEKRVSVIQSPIHEQCYDKKFLTVKNLALQISLTNYYPHNDRATSLAHIVVRTHHSFFASSHRRGRHFCSWHFTSNRLSFGRFTLIN